MDKPLLIIKTGSTISTLLATGEDFEHWFIAGCGLPASRFLVRNLHFNEALPEVADVAGIIITGSAAYVTDLADWNYSGADYLRSAHALGVPILGICYGHQLLAWAFGGRVGFNPNGREIGTVSITATEASVGDVLFGELPRSFKAQVSHQQSVIALPAGAVRLAENAWDSNHGFRLGQTTWGVQFHPEFSAEISRAYINQRAAAITAEGRDVGVLLEAVQESVPAALVLQRFADYCGNMRLRVTG